MYGWIIKVCATAVVLNIISYIIPNGRIKGAALVAMGFMFVTIILPPIRLAKNELLNKKYFIECYNSLIDRYESINNAVTEITNEDLEKEDLAKKVYGSGTITMLQDALIKCLEGKTSFEEVYRNIEIENEMYFFLLFDLILLIISETLVFLNSSLVITNKLGLLSLKTKLVYALTMRPLPFFLQEQLTFPQDTQQDF